LVSLAENAAPAQKVVLFVASDNWGEGVGEGEDQARRFLFEVNCVRKEIITEIRVSCGNRTYTTPGTDLLYTTELVTKRVTAF
jgi:hypothetical protein